MNILHLTPTAFVSSPLMVFNAASMTAAEYVRLYATARRQSANLSIKARAEIARIYRKAADEAAAVARDVMERGLSELTSERWASMAVQLKDAADDIASGVERIGRKLVTDAGSLFPEIDSRYVLAAVAEAGAAKSVTSVVMGRLTAAVNRKLVESLATRIWSDGYTFSERCWNLREDWLERIKSTVAAGIAQGRDPVKIARDIQVYTADGKVALAQRWGKLERGTAEFAKRIPGRVDWRAARLVRSELYASLQDAGIAAGEINPGATGEFDWVLSPGREDWPCACAEFAVGGPYKADQVPTYPHPHCQCTVRPRLRDRKEFVADLRKKFVHGESVDYLDTWYDEKYKAAV